MFMFLGSIHTLLEDGGLIMMLVGAGIFKSPTCATTAMKGKQYARGLLALKKVWEVLSGNRLKLHIAHVRAKGSAEEKGRLAKYLTLLARVRDDGGAAARVAINSPESKAFLTDHETWIRKQSAADGTIHHINNALLAIGTTFRFLRASRDIKQAKLWGWWGTVLDFSWLTCVANRGLYERMIAIQDKKIRTARAVHGDRFANDLEHGAVLAITRTAQVFSSVCPDMHLETNSNRLAKILLTFLASRKSSWRMAMSQLNNRMHTVQAASKLMKSAERPVAPRRKKAAIKWRKRNKRYGVDIENLRQFIQDIGLTVEPPDPNPSAVRHLTSGVIAQEMVSKSLLEAMRTGQAHWDKVRGRMDGGTVSIWDPIKKHPTLTFKHNGATQKDQLAAVKNAARKVSCLVQMLTLNESLDTPITMWDKDNDDCIARYELTDWAVSLFGVDGVPLKATKASFATKLYGARPQRYVPPSDVDPSAWASFIDFANYLQRAPKGAADKVHMVDLISQAAKMLLAEALHNQTGIVFICCDTYPEDGTAKDIESKAREKGKSVPVYATINGRDHMRPTPMQKIKTMQAILGAGSNKTRLCAHLVSEVKRLLNAPGDRYAGITKVFVLNSKGPKTCEVITPGHGIGSAWASEEGPADLCFPCIEADQLLISALKWWLQRATSTGGMVVCDDTDVGVALLCYLDAISNGKIVTLLRGPKKETRRRINVGAVKTRYCNKFDDPAHGELLLSAAVGFHTLTGCDVTSYWYGRSKPTLWDLMEELVLTAAGRKLIAAMAQLGDLEGDPGDVPADLWAQLQELACRMYKDERSTTCDQSRGTKMKDGRQPSDWKRLIFTSNSFYQQVKRSDWQAEVWRTCVFRPLESPPDLAGRGFTRARYNKNDPGSECWMPVYKTNGNAPRRLIQAKGCGCNKNGNKRVPHFCKGDGCYCHDNGTPCSATCRCRCTECQNGKPAPAAPAPAPVVARARANTAATTAEEDADEEATLREGMEAGDSDGDEEDPPALWSMASLEGRRVYKSKSNLLKWKGPAYLVKWTGDDPKTGKPYPNSWEKCDHTEPGNISHSLDWDRLLSEFCAASGTDLTVVMGDRYRREGEEDLQSGDEMEMCEGSSSEDDNDDHSSSDNDSSASETEEQGWGGCDTDADDMSSDSDSEENSDNDSEAAEDSDN